MRAASLARNMHRPAASLLQHRPANAYPASKSRRVSVDHRVWRDVAGDHGARTDKRESADPHGRDEDAARAEGRPTAHFRLIEALLYAAGVLDAWPTDVCEDDGGPDEDVLRERDARENARMTLDPRPAPDPCTGGHERETTDDNVGSKISLLGNRGARINLCCSSFLFATNRFFHARARSNVLLSPMGEKCAEATCPSSSAVENATNEAP